jgi:hypothetical protein
LFQPGTLIICVTENGQKFVTTSRLPSYLWLWAVRVRNQATNIKERQRSEIYVRLQMVNQFVTENFNRLTPLETQEIDLFQDPFYRIMLSIVVLGETLTQFVEAHYDIKLATWPRCWFLDALMLKAGWCLYEITLLSKRVWVGNAGLYYLSSLQRRSAQERHNSCLRGRCSADQIDESTYQIKHGDFSCACQHRMGDIDQIVMKGQIPLYSVTSTDGGGCDVQVEAFDPGKKWGARTRYVAISHVWSNGLGNPSRNSLPQCQLQRLQDFCNALYKSKPKHRRFGLTHFVFRSSHTIERRLLRR